MTSEQFKNVEKLKSKISELNEIISEINRDDSFRAKISIYQRSWPAEVSHDAVINAVKYVECQILETFSY